MIDGIEKHSKDKCVLNIKMNGSRKSFIDQSRLNPHSEPPSLSSENSEISRERHPIFVKIPYTSYIMLYALCFYIGTFQAALPSNINTGKIVNSHEAKSSRPIPLDAMFADRAFRL
jgi:hypothetical protein